ncbi:MAG: hypothetical protein P9M15_02270 [Candidatus Electryoneaceae bacterium]|nr:hypothetical protein [Candidatus Electryoneaceae bacterium]
MIRHRVYLSTGRRSEPDHPARLPAFRHARASDGTSVKQSLPTQFSEELKNPTVTYTF